MEIIIIIITLLGGGNKVYIILERHSVHHIPPAKTVDHAKLLL